MKNKKGFWALNIGLLYILPWLVGFILFKVYPFLSSLFTASPTTTFSMALPSTA